MNATLNQAWVEQRRRMVEETLARPSDRRRPVTSTRVLAALARVPRERFIPEALRVEAYADRPVTIGHGQTISQPYMVAIMTQILDARPEHRVLEVGTGSGYQSAVLAELVAQVYTIEIVEPLAARAKHVLGELEYRNVQFRVGDGHRGWPEEAPFDRIVVTAAADEVPAALTDQLVVGGRLVLPVGEQGDVQVLYVIRRTGPGPEDLQQERIMPVRFVPLVDG